MPYKIIEYVPNRVLYTCVWGRYLSEENALSNAEIIAYLDKQSNRVDLIVNFLQMTDYPKNIFSLASSFSMFAHPNHGWQVVVASNRLVRFMAEQTIYIAKGRNAYNKAILCSTTAEACQQLAKTVPELGALTTPLPDLAPANYRIL
ncbi:MAG: hypothetical protein ACOYL5_10980 [Phototrophicaceae bacterium]|jgi:hypothetical protein